MSEEKRNGDTKLISNGDQASDGQIARRKSQRRIEAGRRNRLRRGPLSEAGKARLRTAIRLHKPWKKSSGPKTLQGKLQVVRNGKQRQVGPVSVREMRARLADVEVTIESARILRREVAAILCAGEALDPTSAPHE